MKDFSLVSRVDPRIASGDDGVAVFRRPGGGLLFRVLGRSTIGAGVIYGRVRDGIGYGRPAKATRPAKNRGQWSEVRDQDE